MSDFPGLARYDAMQRAPLGTFSALRRPSPVATQYKRQAEMYGQALRTLSRAARRGDAGAAMQAIDLRDKANANGFTPGGIGRSESTVSNIADREQNLMEMNQRGEQEAGFMQDTLDRRTANPRATPVGRESGSIGLSTPRMSLAEQDAASKEDRTRSGAFGTGAADSLKRLDRRKIILDRAYTLDIPGTYRV